MPHQSKPLTILCHPELLGSEEVGGLLAKGHTVYNLEAYEVQGVNASMVDLILAPNAQLMTPEHLPYLDEAVKRARKLKYPPKAKEASK